MASISAASELAARLLADAIAGRAWSPEDLDCLIASGDSRALFSTLVEGLADRFEPRLCDVYADLFSRVIERAVPELHADALVRQYRAAREVRRVSFEPRRVFVLSRVTLGADIAVTSVILDACLRRFPRAELVFVGPRKAYELFEAEPRLRHAEMPYGRGATLAGRLAIWPELRDLLSQPDSIVLDPDSRLTQLGLLPVCDAVRHFLFESRSYGGDGADALPTLTRRWVRETLDVDDARTWLAPSVRIEVDPGALITCSLGVGENPAKRLPDPFEERLLMLLAQRNARMIVDLGAGGEEAERVLRAIARSGVKAEMHEGSFASFASLIAQSELYAGYDSAGQHAAATLGVPLLCFFAGAVCDRMFQRWSPEGPGPRTIVKAG